MGGYVDIQFVGQRWERDPPRVRIWLECNAPKSGGPVDNPSTRGIPVDFG